MANQNFRQKTRRPRRGLRLLIFLLVMVGLLGVLSYNRQGISDSLVLRKYQAPTLVAAIADRDTMTEAARRIFYVNAPNIADKASFAKQCPSGNEQTVVLGCYHGDQEGIYVLAVSDSRLSGIEEVTAAHEMLHAAYDRLSSRQKQQIDVQLNDYYDHDLKDASIKAQIDGYKKSEPGELTNEMHSILGSEVSDLPAALETYYARYFTNRATITSFYARYQGEFTTRQAAIKADDAQLSTMKAQITADEADLKTQDVALQSRRNKLDSLRSSGDTAGYNAQVPVYNAQVESYNRQVATTRTLITQYNQLVNQRNAIVLETQQLANEINSSATPVSQ